MAGQLLWDVSTISLGTSKCFQDPNRRATQGVGCAIMHADQSFVLEPSMKHALGSKD